MSKQINRKNQHVSLSENFYNDADSALKDVHFVHHSFPGMDVSDVDLSSEVGDLKNNSPHI